MFFSLRIEKRTGKESTQHELRDVTDATHYIIQNDGASIDVRLRKRNAYPTTYCRRVDGNTYELGYGKDIGVASEHMSVRVSSDGRVNIVRDAYAGLPLYFVAQEGALFMSNLYEEALAVLTRATVSKEYIFDFLGQPGRYSPYTLCDEIRSLGEREELIYENGKLSIRQPESRRWEASHEAPRTDPRQFREAFQASLTRFVDTRLTDNVFACELSGGLDSSTLPLFLRRQGITDYMTASVIFTGSNTHSQLEKLASLAEHTEARTMTVPIHEATDYPLHSMIDTGIYAPFHARDPFHETFADLAMRLHQMGTEVVATGIGGDELFGNAPASFALHGAEHRQWRQSAPLPEFMTATFRSDFVEATPKESPYALAPLSTSFYRVQQVNNRYIEHGIWCVSPFSDPELYEFCQGLPVEYRSNKNILRMFYEAYKWPKAIYHPKQNEHFRGALEKGAQTGKYEDLTRRLTENSYTIRKGYVDKDNLWALYKEMKEGLDSEERSIQWLKWMMLEINLQHTEQLQN